MNTAIPAILLLVCIVICTSEGGVVPIEMRCRCPRTNARLDKRTTRLIKSVQQLPPRPYCSKTEVIVTLKNKQICLDPNSSFTKKVLASRTTKQRQSQ